MGDADNKNGNPLSESDSTELTLRVFEDLGFEQQVGGPKGARIVLPDVNEDEESEYVSPDERFKQKKPEHEIIRERLQKQIDLEKRFNRRQRILNYFTRPVSDSKLGFFKLIYNMAYAGGFLLNLFTVVIMVAIISYVTFSLIGGGLSSWFDIARVSVGIAMILVINYIHKQIKP